MQCLCTLVDNVFLASDNFRVKHVVVWGSEKWQGLPA
jgi:hypothetical protein